MPQTAPVQVAGKAASLQHLPNDLSSVSWHTFQGHLQWQERWWGSRRTYSQAGTSQVPVGTIWLCQDSRRSVRGFAPNLSVLSAELSLTHHDEVSNRALSSEICYNGSYLYLFSFHKKYPFLAEEVHPEHPKAPLLLGSLSYFFLLLSMWLNNALHVQQKHFKFITLWTSTKAPELIQILSCCSSRHFSVYTNTFCSSTDNHLPLHPPRKVSYWLTWASRWLLIWGMAGVMEAVQGRDPKEQKIFNRNFMNSEVLGESLGWFTILVFKWWVKLLKMW